jgi:hypothetical protein
MKLVWLAALLVSCRKEVLEREESSYDVEETAHCTHMAVCYGCGGISFDGKTGCGIGVHPTCPGTQRVITRVTPYRFHYEDEPGASMRGARRSRVRELEPCR